MKEQISGSEKNLSSTYSLFSFIPILTGSLFLILISVENDMLSKSDFIKFFAIGNLIFGALLLLASNLFVPYCHKIEVDSEKIYITKSESLLLTQVEKTIEIDKDDLKKVTSGLLGLKFFWKEERVFYLELKAKTEYGTRIAFLSKSKFLLNHDYPEFRKLKK
jgi:hypothetical protein